MSKDKILKQFGLWPSPITPISMARGIGFSDIAWDQDGTLVWRESRSDRGVLLIQSPDGQAPRDFSSEFNVRAGVGYGGGDFTVGHGYIFFVEAESGRIYRQPTDMGSAKPIIPAFGSAASPAISPNGKYILYVHTNEGKDCIAFVDSEGSLWPQKLISGEDFYMQPCWHPDNQQIAWISWNHPQMPWDGTGLHLANITISSSGSLELGESRMIAGDEKTAVFGAQFSPNGRYLAYVSDPDGWWQLFVYDLVANEHQVLTSGEAEHGIPAWNQGMRTFDFSPDGNSIYFLRNKDGIVGLYRINIRTKVEERIRVGAEYTWMKQVAVSPVGERVAVIASGGRVPERIIQYGVSEGTRVVCRSIPEEIPEKTYSLPTAISWTGMDGNDVFGVYYAPDSIWYAGIGVPPLLVLIHGGPTSQSGAGFDKKAQYFASRGWAVLQVNYRGSSGYGRNYRDKLKGNWGVYDVQDAVAGARHLVEKEQVDAEKLVIMGGSAGGFTVLKALADYPGFFRAGVCSYGVANHFSLAADTHKFEERYLDSLLGPLPEASHIYRERSPIFFADKIQDAIIVFQGEDDKVVLQDQSTQIVSALQRNGVTHEYHLYPGEGHGFRRTETIESYYTSLEEFLRTNVIYS